MANKFSLLALLLMLPVLTQVTRAQQIFEMLTPVKKVDIGTLPGITLNSPPVSNGGNLTIKQDNVVLSGNVKDNDGIYSFTLNGKEIVPDAKGNFEMSVPLQTGNNNIKLVATDLGNNKNELSFIILHPDASLPRITITQPKGVVQQGVITLLQNEFTLRGSATDEAGIEQVTVNGTKVTLSGGDFSAGLPLQFGNNSISIAATDIYDNSSEFSFTVRRPDNDAPDIKVLNTNLQEEIPLVTIAPTFTLQAIITDNNSISKVLLNGSAQTIGSSGSLQQTIALSIGSNNVEIIAYDREDNHSRKQFIIERRKDNPPVIEVTQPNIAQASTYNTNKSEITLQGRVTDEVGISALRLNGNTQAFDTDGTFTATLKLAYGENRLHIEAVDKSNKLSSYDFTVLRQTGGSGANNPEVIPDAPKPVSATKPQIDWQYPALDEVEVDQPQLTVKACIKSNSDLSEVSVYLDNRPYTLRGLKPVSPGNNSCTQYIEETIQLPPSGKHTIQIAASNSAGTALLTRTVVVKQADANRLDQARNHYYALLIGVEDYQHTSMTDLDHPLEDIENMRSVLTEKYTFAPENVKVLKNPTRDNIYDILDQYTRQLGNADNLLIFYAGHGYWDEGLQQGYWQPADAQADSRSKWFSNSNLQEYLRGIKTRHTLVIADACFGGSLFKTRSGSNREKAIAAEKIYELPSRTAITSGAKNEEVPDKSVFVEYIVKRLRDNTDPYLDASALFERIKNPVISNSPTHPQDGLIQNAGDEGGDFIFILK